MKTALVLAGLQADGTTEIVEPRPSRDHTERMLARPRRAGHAGRRPRRARHRAARPRRSSSRCPAIRRRPRSSWWRPPSRPARSSCSRTSRCNPTRIGFVDVLRRMGAAHRDGRDRRAARRAGRRAPRRRARRCTAPRSRAPRSRSYRRDPGARGRGRVRRGRHRVPRRRRAAGEGERPHRHASSELLTHLGVGAEPRRRRARRPGRSPAAGRGRRATATTASPWPRRSPPARSRARPRCGAGASVATSYPEFAADLAALTGDDAVTPT